MGVSSARKAYWIAPLAFLGSLIAFYQLAYPLLNDNDVPWHLAIGKLLLETHRLPLTDPWAYGNQDQPWFILSWVWDLLLGIVEKCSGAFGIFIFTLLIGAGLVAGVTARLIALNIALPAVIMTSILTGICLLDYITARPQLAGYMLALAFHAALHYSRSDRDYKRLLWLPPLMLIWANAHGSFMVGFIIIGAYAAEAWFTHKSQWLKRLAIIALVCALCAAINPYGPEVTLGALLSFKGAATKYTMEWMPFSFAASTGLSVWLVMLILSSNLKGAGVSIADKILAMGWLLATMFSIRNGAFFILTSAPYLATCLDEQTRSFRTVQPPTKLMLFMNRQPLRRIWMACLIAAVIFASIAAALPHADKIESEDFAIKDAIDYAQAHYPHTHYLTDYSLGGQVIYHTQGKLPFFMDSRAVTAYSDQSMQDFLDFLRLAPGWEEKLEQRGLNGIIVPNSSAFAANYDKGLYHEAWKLVFTGKRASVYIARR